MTARRSFLAHFGAAAAAFGFGSAASSAATPFDAQEAAAAARTAAPVAARWQPARDAKDDWLEQIPGKHRLFFDAVSPEGVASALQYAGNFFTANKDGYGLEAGDLAVVICLRHRGTQFAFSDSIWSKYGAALSESETFTDPKSGQVPTANVYRTRLDENVKRGVHFAVCSMATRRLANYIARKIENGNADAIYKELTGNAVGNAHFVPAGIVAVNRAQERGYAVAHGG
jgi:intracellular sulfur oxidation DsrE/DsrF family protein